MNSGTVSALQKKIERHLLELRQCDRCPQMHKPVVVGSAVAGKILLVGQAPGVKEPQLGRPFAWTAGKTLFRWIEYATGWDESAARQRIYFAAVCRCFPGKNPAGGDRVPDVREMEACSHWLEREIQLLRPSLVLPVGRLAISRFMEFDKLSAVVGREFEVSKAGHSFRLLPLPHPSGASTWHRTDPGKTLLERALKMMGLRVGEITASWPTPTPAHEIQAKPVLRSKQRAV